ncbi:MAG: cytochrome b/b6 domain-containing protein [Syntrophales bacterium]|jgi:cytochrome b subunit of formate dehydrogenase|nr:cytochrome b/b6 domain-containing protein [Syntrophales bacterium]
MTDRILHEDNAVLRHSGIEIAEHWAVAISGIFLLFSGFGEFPMYKRYMVTSIPGFSWAGDFWIHLKIHYIAAIVFTSAIAFHILHHGLLGDRGLLPRRGDFKASWLTIKSFLGLGEEPKADKYLPEQRLAYIFIGVVSLILIGTGLVKVVKNLPWVYLPPGIMSAATLIHTFATFLFLFGFIAHIGALVLKVNWPMVPGIFTGKADLEYVKHRHTIWYERLLAPERPQAEMAPPAENAAVSEPSEAPALLDAAATPETPEADRDVPEVKPEEMMDEKKG